MPLFGCCLLYRRCPSSNMYGAILFDTRKWRRDITHVAQCCGRLTPNSPPKRISLTTSRSHNADLVSNVLCCFRPTSMPYTFH